MGDHIVLFSLPESVTKFIELFNVGGYMRIQIVMSLVGKLLYIFGAFLVIPFIYSILFETAYWSFCITAILSILLGGLLVLGGNKSKTFSLRDGFLVVSSTWILTMLLGAFPLLYLVY